MWGNLYVWLYGYVPMVLVMLRLLHHNYYYYVMYLLLYCIYCMSTWLWMSLVLLNVGVQKNYGVLCKNIYFLLWMEVIYLVKAEKKYDGTEWMLICWKKIRFFLYFIYFLKCFNYSLFLFLWQRSTDNQYFWCVFIKRWFFKLRNYYEPTDGPNTTKIINSGDRLN